MLRPWAKTSRDWRYHRAASLAGAVASESLPGAHVCGVSADWHGGYRCRLLPTKSKRCVQIARNFISAELRLQAFIMVQPRLDDFDLERMRWQPVKCGRTCGIS